jgi:light-regulated signal transduction histidine kinase (bacteriophytochrome)
MKPLLSEERDNATLQNLGRASLQIIHDIKNQLNGLKLYATYLRKRMEKIEAADELQETLGKLIGGIDRAANDLNVLVQYGRPISLSKHQGIDIQKVMRGVAAGWADSNGAETNCELAVESEEPMVGEFDPTALTEAFRAICLGASKASTSEKSEPVKVGLTHQKISGVPCAVIEWKPVNFSSEDPFQSFNGSDAIRMSLAAKIIEAHGGSAQYKNHSLRVCLPLL